jgi:hypothetical protein
MRQIFTMLKAVGKETLMLGTTHPVSDYTPEDLDKV